MLNQGATLPCPPGQPWYAGAAWPQTCPCPGHLSVITHAGVVMPKKDLQRQGHLFLQSAYAHSPPSAATYALLALVTVLGSALFASVECKQETEVARTVGLGGYLFSCYLPCTCELGVTQQCLGGGTWVLCTVSGCPGWVSSVARATCAPHEKRLHPCCPLGMGPCLG